MALCQSFCSILYLLYIHEVPILIYNFLQRDRVRLHPLKLLIMIMSFQQPNLYIPVYCHPTITHLAVTFSNLDTTLHALLKTRIILNVRQSQSA
ncbi:hypothetical protein Sjap_018415 [Stephania japonica]|uniref:Uncharacterized protein n=1 Tax=Stephania japonica TaxID=461633 RepID=A0AAP0I829_9MAGN